MSELNEAILGEAEIKKDKVWRLAMHIVIATFLFSYSLGVFNTCAENVSATLDWGSQKNTNIAIFSAMIPIGAFCGSSIAGFFCDRFGRRVSFMIADLIFAIGSGLSVVPFTAVFGIGRYFCGFASGLYIGISPLYVNEITPDSMTIVMGPMVQVSNNAALIFAYGFGLMLPSSNYKSDSLNQLWIFLFLFPGAIAMYRFGYFAFVMKLDSPKWYLDKGLIEKAREAILYTHHSSAVEAGLRRFKEKSVDSEEKKQPEVTFKELFTNQKFRKMLRIGVLLSVIQQMSGINANIFYSTATFRKIGGSESLAKLLTFVMGVINFIAGMMTLPLLKRYGRKTLMISGQYFLFVICIILGLFSGIIDAGNALPLIAINAYMVFFAYSLGATLWAYIGEMCIDKAVTVSVAVNLFFTCLITISFPFLAEAFGISTVFFIFAGSLALSIIYCHWDLIETKGKTKPEIFELLFNK